MKSNVEYTLQAILSEYDALRSEILNRMDFQNRILQLHITTLTVILGASLTQPLGHLIILLIPLASSILGLWWFDHGANVEDLGKYIKFCIEDKICQLLNDPTAMAWEHKVEIRTLLNSKKRVSIFDNLIRITFLAPSFTTLLITLVLLLLNFPAINTLLQYISPISIKPVYTGSDWWAASVVWIVGSISSLIYIFRSARPY